MKRIGYMVIEHADDFEQPLGLMTGKHLPPGGVLIWTDGDRAVFPDRAAAKAAITRTDHYRLAFGDAFVDGVGHLPERRFLKVVPVSLVGEPA